MLIITAAPIIEALSKIGFRSKVEADTSFPAGRDFPPGGLGQKIPFVGGHEIASIDKGAVMW